MDKLMKARQTRAALEAFASQAAAGLSDDAALKMAAAFPSGRRAPMETGSMRRGRLSSTATAFTG